jgi:ribosomal protein L18
MTRMFGSWFKFDKRKHLLLLLTNKKVQGQIVDKREGKVEITVTSIQKSLLPGGKRPVNEYACANMESARKVGEELASFAERHQIREVVRLKGPEYMNTQLLNSFGSSHHVLEVEK